MSVYTTRVTPVVKNSLDGRTSEEKHFDVMNSRLKDDNKEEILSQEPENLIAIPLRGLNIDLHLLATLEPETMEYGPFSIKDVVNHCLWHLEDLYRHRPELLEGNLSGKVDLLTYKVNLNQGRSSFYIGDSLSRDRVVRLSEEDHSIWVVVDAVINLLPIIHDHFVWERRSHILSLLDNPTPLHRFYILSNGTLYINERNA